MRTLNSNTTNQVSPKVSNNLFTNHNMNHKGGRKVTQFKFNDIKRIKQLSSRGESVNSLSKRYDCSRNAMTKLVKQFETLTVSEIYISRRNNTLFV